MSKPHDRKPSQPKDPHPTAEAMKDAKILKLQSSRSHSDVLGSYTGTDADGGMPEQDADDL